MKKIKTTIIIITAMLLSSCGYEDPYPNGHKYITIINNSEMDIEYINRFRDTFFCERGGITIPFTIKSDSSLVDIYENHAWMPISWENYFDREETLNIFFVSQVYYQYWKQPCDTIRKYVPVLHHYKLKLEDLQRMNWTVVYPPEE